MIEINDKEFHVVVQALSSAITTESDWAFKFLEAKRDNDARFAQEKTALYIEVRTRLEARFAARNDV